MANYKSPLDLGRDLQEEDAQQSRVVKPIEYIDPTGKKWTRGDFKDETNLANEYDSYETGDQNDLTKFFRNLVATSKK